MFWNSLSIWLAVPEEALIVPFLSVSQFSVPHHVPGERRKSTPGMTMAFHCRTEDATFKGWKAPSIYVHIPAENEEKDLVICFLTGIFDDFLVLGWFHATRKHRGVDFTYWGFFKLMELFMCAWTRSEIMAVFTDLIQRGGIHNLCYNRNL